MKKSLTLILGVLLLSSFVVAIKTFESKEGTSIMLDNGICEGINLEFKEGETKTFSIEGLSFTVKYLGAKIVPYNYDSEDYSAIPFMKAGEERTDEESGIESMWEYEDKEYNYLSNIFQDKLEGFHLHLEDSADVETEWEGEEYTESYKGTAHIRGYEKGFTTDCVGLDKTNEWGNSYLNEIKFHKGWNLVPRDIHIYECRGGAKSQICYDDFMNEPIKYFFDPVEKNYFTEDWVEEYVEKKGDDYWDDYEEELERKIMNEMNKRGLDESSFNDEGLDIRLDFIIDVMKDGEVFLNMLEWEGLYGGAQWIYVTEDLAGKSYMHHAHSGMEGSFGVALFEGWNLQYVFPEYVFKKDWEYELRPKSLNDLKGTCEIIEAHFFDPATQSWISISLDQKFGEEDLHKGFAIKVKGDCRIGQLRMDQGAPPVLPAV